MYLVLTALLALNVSKDLLNAFVVINERIEHTDEVMQAKNSGILAQFQSQMSIDPEKVGPHFERAQEVRTAANAAHQKVAAIKRHLISSTAGYDANTADSLFQLRLVDKKDNYDTPTEVLIGSDPAFPKDGPNTALELKAIIQELTEQFGSVFDPVADSATLEKIKANLSLDPVPNADGKPEPWEVGNFYHLPLAACVTNLSKLQSDIRAAEGEALSALYANVSMNDYKFDTIAARAIPKSSYVLLGEPYEAQLFLAAFSTTEQPVMTLRQEGSTDTVLVSNGIGDLKLNTTREGLHDYTGSIEMKLSNGDSKSFPFAGEYLVARPSLTVAATKMKVLYKGVENPLKISVPGIPSEHLRVSITGGNSLQKQSADEYMAKLANNSPRQAEIVVSRIDESGATKLMGKEVFEVKNLPAPFAQIGQVQGTGTMRSAELISKQGIKAAYDPSFIFQLSAQVISFDMSAFYRGQMLEDQANSPYFTDKMKTIIESLRPGTVVTFSNIKAKGSDDVIHKLGPVNITIR